LIEDDYIQLREGAQKMVAATAAVAKVAAAAAASTPYSSYMSTVAVTPMAQSHRMKKVPSIDSKNIKSDKALQEYAVISSNLGDDSLKLSVMQHQQSNGPGFSVSGGLSNVKILSKSKDSREMDGPESRIVQSVGNGGSAQISGSANGRLVSSFTSKQQTRYDSITSVMTWFVYYEKKVVELTDCCMTGQLVLCTLLGDSKSSFSYLNMLITFPLNFHIRVKCVVCFGLAWMN